MNNCNDQIRPVLESAFSEQVSIQPDGGDCKVTVPFETANFDSISVWVIEKENGYLITDEGQVYGDLYLANIDVDRDLADRRIKSIEERYDLNRAKYQISATARPHELGKRILDVVRAAQGISHLVYKRRKFSPSDFQGMVGEYLSEEGFRFTPNVELPGESSPHIVDFEIKNRPAYVQTIHAESTSSARTQADRTAIMWVELKERFHDYDRISVYNDVNGVVDDQAINRLRSYSDHSVAWSNKEQIVNILG